MLRSLEVLAKYKVSAVDGDIGRVTDFLFDDQQWPIRYLVTDASGFWERPIQVLISPISFQHVDWATRLFHSSPSVDLSKPVSRQYEHACSQYYGWPLYWGFGDTQGMAAYPNWAQRINWSESMVYLDLTKDAIASSPSWNPQAELTRELEESLHEYFARPRYRSGDDSQEEPSKRSAVAAGKP